MNFTNDEMNLMCIYNPGSRESLLRQTNPHCPQVRILLPFHAFFHFGNHLDCKKLQPYLVYLIFH